MTIWILALVLIASLAGLGLRQGAIRVAFSFVGILIGAMLASPIGHLLAPLAAKLPMWGWMLGPVVVFIFIVGGFKVAGATVHRKAFAHYKHKVSDLEGAMWERMNHRVGLCLGVANGALYLMLVSFAIYTPTYWTYQLGQSDAAENSRT
ncbi:MAG TPA: CvpA family protein, partial [Verrucomicrobiae bacterium]|nr:CvpA family protein [Verrucomicrobiae bacterium]